MNSRAFRLTVVVDGAGPRLPLIIRNFSDAEAIGLLGIGETVEVAMPKDFEYFPWKRPTTSDSAVLAQIDAPSLATGLVVLRAIGPGMADLVATALPSDSSISMAGFFRIEFIVRPLAHLVDVTTGAQDYGKDVPAAVGQVVAVDISSGSTQSALSSPKLDGNQVAVELLERPSLDAPSKTAYLLARARGNARFWWTNCFQAQGVNPSCPPGVLITVEPSKGLAVEANDSDNQKRFTVQVGDTIIVTLHPYIAPWQGIVGSWPNILQEVSHQMAGGLESWTYRATAPGIAELDATYPCPMGVGCPPHPSIGFAIINQ